MLEQVLHSLIHNAAEYIPKYTAISIQVTLRKDNHLVLIIEDTEKGFPKNEIDHMFKKLYRLKNTHVSETGLGLPIVKGFVESIGCTVKLENGADPICASEFFFGTGRSGKYQR